MKKVIFSSAVLFLIFVSNVFATSYGGGTGDPNSPYQIYDANQLNIIGLHAEDWDKCFILMNDIDLSGFAGDEFNIIGVDIDHCFRGKFDGQGHVIRNFTYISPDSNNVGLFVYFGDDSGDYPELKNLGLENVNIEGNDKVGALIGNVSEYDILVNCYSSGVVKGHNYVGGLIGSGSEGLTNCHSSCDVTGNNCVGGLMGFGDTNFHYCSSSGNVTGNWKVGGLVGELDESRSNDSFSTSYVTGVSCVGGLVGLGDESELKNCYSTGNVTASGANVGGLIGEFTSDELINCYSKSDVNGVDYVGGLVGSTSFTDYDNCYSSGKVLGDTYVGGLIGGIKFTKVTVTNCFWDVEASGVIIGVGVGDSAGVTGKTTTEMKIDSTFTDAGWDFVGVWGIGQGQTYPYLRKYSAADMSRDGIVNFFDFAILAENWLE